MAPRTLRAAGLAATVAPPPILSLSHAFVNRFWSPVVGTLRPYVPGEQPRQGGVVKLNTNENPYPPSPGALAAMHGVVDADLRLYPDPESTRLRETLARCHEVAVDNVFVGNGSDEVLAHVFRALLDHGAPVRFPDISYSFYPVYCALFGIEAQPVPLSEDFDLQVDDYAGGHGGIVFPNPNAPTGKHLPLSEVERLVLANSESVVVVDEAYVDFGGDSAVPLTRTYDNLLVVQTLSKSRSLAGLRVGYAIGDAGLIEALLRVKNSFNSYPLDRFAQAGAVAAMLDQAHFEETRRRIMDSRERLAAALAGMDFTVLPSKANFLFARHHHRGGAELADALRRRGVLVRHFSQDRIEDFLRITVGTEAECQALVDALGEILAGDR